MSANDAGQFLAAATKGLGKAQWEWIAAARVLSRKRASTAALEQVLEGLLGDADEAMVNAFTSGFRVAQTRLAIGKVLPPETTASALESAQVVALAILVREQMEPAHFAALYRPFATILPGPGYELPPPIDRQIAAFVQWLPTLSGESEAEVALVVKALSEAPKRAVGIAAAAEAGTAAVAAGAPVEPIVDAAALYAAAWKGAIATANSGGRTYAFRAAQDGAEQVAPHDGSGIVGSAGVAAGGIFMRDMLPIEQVLLLYEPFAAALPYESLH